MKFKEVMKTLKTECEVGRVTTRDEARDFVAWKIQEYLDAEE